MTIKFGSRRLNNHYGSMQELWRDEMECAIEVHDCHNGFGGLGLEEDSRELKGRTQRNKQYNKQIGHWPCSGTGQSIIQCAMHTLL